MSPVIVSPRPVLGITGPALAGATSANQTTPFSAASLSATDGLSDDPSIVAPDTRLSQEGFLVKAARILALLGSGSLAYFNDATTPVEKRAASSSPKGIIAEVIRRRVLNEAREKDATYSVSVEESEDGTLKVTDEDGNTWKVVPRERGSERSFIKGASLDEDNFKRSREGVKAPLFEGPGTPWSVPLEVERDMRGRYLDVLLSKGDANLIAGAIEYSTRILLHWRLDRIGSNIHRMHMQRRLCCLFDHTHFGEAEIRTDQDLIAAASHLIRQVAPDMPEGTNINLGNILKYMLQSGDKVFENLSIFDTVRKVLKLGRELSPYLEIFHGSVSGLFVPKLFEIVIPPRTYAWQRKNPLGHLRLASTIGHETEHAVIEGKGGGIIANILRVAGSQGLLNVLLNPFSEVAGLLFTYWNEGAARGAEWEIFSRIPPITRKVLLKNIAVSMGYEIEGLVQMDERKTCMELISMHEGEELFDRLIMTKLFYEIYDSLVLSKAEFVELRRIIDGYDRRLPYLEFMRQWNTAKRDGSKLKKALFLSRLALISMPRFTVPLILACALLPEEK